MRHPDTVEVRQAGKAYQIPAMWLAGATHSRTYPEAIAAWIEQAEAEEEVRRIANGPILGH